MIKSFANKHLEGCFIEGKCGKVPSTLRDRLLVKLDILDAAEVIEDLRSPPGNRLHELSGDRAGFLAIAVNGPWRILFRFKDGDAYDVELEQYH